LRPDPVELPENTLAMSGFFGNSDRPGFRRLYFTRDLNYYAEFRIEDVLYTASIPAEEEPFLGDQATRLMLRRDATLEYTRVRTARPVDEFDLDVRLGAHRASDRVELISVDSCAIGCPLYPTRFGPCPTDYGWTCEPSGCEC
jgi:hypothetical protein